MKRKHIAWLLAAILLIGCSGLTSCETLHGYWGVGSEYGYDSHHDHHHKPKPPKKHKKHKKHHHHHDDDDWDDD
ncbi:MAG: hypothetical protein J6B03_06515 [Candidatus Homeothermus sp.]|nr:hypothetical protein [Candidatus Homeothermus sp.]PWL61670.1 MAG: hypothetical protein DBY35_04980 [Bacteroidales bacterium]